ncbi:MAG: PmoA family protein [Phycisphaerales bacterium]
MRLNLTIPAATLLIPVIAAIGGAKAADVTLVVSDPNGTAARVGAPVSVEMDVKKHFGAGIEVARLRLVELTGPGSKAGDPVPVQFVPSPVDQADAKPTDEHASTGTLWWLMPLGQKSERRFRLTVADRPDRAAIAITIRGDGSYYDVAEGELPVLRYNFANVPVPEGTPPHFAEGESYERGDYISPLYGPGGEVLTEDYPRDHPHHRGIWWSWPVTRWREEVFDIWAVVGVHARPVAMRRAEAGPVLAVLEPESVWKWKDQHPVVREEVVIRAFRQANRCRTVDVEVRLTALVDGVAIGGRPKVGYGGFTLRAAPCRERKITLHRDPDTTTPRRAWIDYSGVFEGDQGLSGVTIFEDVDNPGYPNPQHQYPDCSCVMPAFPAMREVPLRVGRTLVLKHRLWIHPGGADEKQLADVWSACAHPPDVRLEE